MRSQGWRSESRRSKIGRSEIGRSKIGRSEGNHSEGRRSTAMRSNGASLRRLLLIIPYAARCPGVPIAVLARRLGVHPACLMRDIERLNLIGAPPRGPDDLIDVEVRRGRVFVHLDQHFGEVPALTLREAVALWMGAQRARLGRLSGSAGGSDVGIDVARTRLREALAEGERAAFERQAGRFLVGGGPMGAELALLCQAIEASLEVRFQSLDIARARLTRHVVVPLATGEARGRWWLDALQVRGEERRAGRRRLFEVDKLINVALTGRQGVPGAGPEAREMAGQVEAPRQMAIVEVAATLGDWFARALPVGAEARLAQGAGQAREQGWQVFEVALDDRAGLIRLVVSLGGRARVISPPELRRAVARMARQALDAHASLERLNACEEALGARG